MVRVMVLPSTMRGVTKSTPAVTPTVFRINGPRFYVRITCITLSDVQMNASDNP